MIFKKETQDILTNVLRGVSGQGAIKIGSGEDYDPHRDVFTSILYCSRAEVPDDEVVIIAFHFNNLHLLDSTGHYILVHNRYILGDKKEGYKYGMF